MEVMEAAKTIIVRMIPRRGFFFNKGLLAYDRATETIGCELSSKDGTYKTGLTPEEEREYETKLNLKQGELNKRSPWWGENIVIRLEKNKPNFIIIDTPMTELKYKVLMNSSKVAKSELDIKKSPNAIFYIVDDEAKAKIETETADYEFEAHELMSKMSPDEKKATLRIFGKKGVASHSETVVKAELLKQLKKDPKAFTAILKDKRLKTRMLTEELIEFGIITRSGHYFRNGDDTIASSTDELLSYLDDIKNQSVKMAMQSRLDKKKAKV
jgi:hypothetical protein